MAGLDFGGTTKREVADELARSATGLPRRSSAGHWALGAAVLDRGRLKPWKCWAELVRTAIVASAFAWIAAQADDLDVGDGVVLALVAWVGFPLVLLSGSVRTSSRFGFAPSRPRA